MNGNLQHVVYVAGVARSGTSWLGQIFAAHPRVRYRFQPLFAYEFKDRVHEDSPAEAYERLLADIFASKGDFLEQRKRQETGEYPKHDDSEADVLVVKENRYQMVIQPMMRRLPEIRVVGIIRNPCAVLNSWRKNEKEFPPGADFRAEWRYGMCKNAGPQDCFGYYRWKQAAHLYLDLADQFPERFCLVRYEDLVAKPKVESRRILESCGLDWQDSVADFVEASTTNHNNSYYAVFKSSDVADRWRGEMPEDVVGEIQQDLVGTRLYPFFDASMPLPSRP